MKVIVFGATGMIGQGVLRECTLAPDVEAILTVGRRPLPPAHARVKDLPHEDFANFEPVADRLAGYDACFFCLGVSSGGMSEADYTRVTYDYTLAAANTLARLNPGMTFIYVSGAGTDSSEKGSAMWARVKGRTENALLRLPFKAAWMFRPGIIRPMHGAVSRTASYRAFYIVARPFWPLLQALAPRQVTTTEVIGRAMLNAVRHGAPKKLLDPPDINDLAALA